MLSRGDQCVIMHTLENRVHFGRSETDCGRYQEEPHDSRMSWTFVEPGVEVGRVSDHHHLTRQGGAVAVKVNHKDVVED